MELAGVPCPVARPGQLLLRTQCSLISAGTERMLLEFSQANLLQKARQQLETSRFEMLLSVRQILNLEQWQEMQRLRQRFEHNRPDRMGPNRPDGRHRPGDDRRPPGQPRR